MQQWNSLILYNLGCSFHFWDVNCPAVPALHTDKSIIKTVVRYSKQSQNLQHKKCFLYIYKRKIRKLDRKYIMDMVEKMAQGALHTFFFVVLF